METSFLFYFLRKWSLGTRITRKKSPELYFMPTQNSRWTPGIQSQLYNLHTHRRYDLLIIYVIYNTSRSHNTSRMQHPRKKQRKDKILDIWRQHCLNALHVPSYFFSMFPNSLNGTSNSENANNRLNAYASTYIHIWQHNFTCNKKAKMINRQQPKNLLFLMYIV